MLIKNTFNFQEYFDMSAFKTFLGGDFKVCTEENDQN